MCSLIKEYLVVQKDEAEMELAETSMGMFVLRENQGPLCEPVEIGIIIYGVEVLNGQSSVASAFAMLFALIYTLNLKSPLSSFVLCKRAFEKETEPYGCNILLKNVKNLHNFIKKL